MFSCSLQLTLHFVWPSPVSFPQYLTPALPPRDNVDLSARYRLQSVQQLFVLINKLNIGFVWITLGWCLGDLWAITRDMNFSILTRTSCCNVSFFERAIMWHRATIVPPYCWWGLVAMCTRGMEWGIMDALVRLYLCWECPGLCRRIGYKESR